MSGNTELGKAVRGACDELDSLGQLVRGALGTSTGDFPTIVAARGCCAAAGPT